MLKSPRAVVERDSESGAASSRSEEEWPVDLKVSLAGGRNRIIEG